MDAVIEPAEFDRRIDDLIALTKAVPLARDTREIFYPGEIEDRAEDDARRQGVDLPDQTVGELRALADACGVPAHLFDSPMAV